MILPGVCHEFKEDTMSKIFQKEAKKFSEITFNFNKCLKDVSIEAIYTNEPTIGNLITKTEL